jgi:transcription termination factor NusB
MKSKFLIYSLPILGIIALSYSFIAASMENKVADTSTAAVELKTGMRKLWSDHVTWTRNVIFNIVDELPGTDEAVKRLQKNQDDIGNAIKPYYGDDAGKKLADLLHTHISQAAELLKALKGDDQKGVDEVSKKWKENADEISTFLSKANPNWKLENMKKMMQDHLSLTTNEAKARKDKDYAADVKAYDKVVDEITEMSDMLSMGIIQQFPDKFKTTKPIGAN